ncbi:MAG: hypothetical protein IPO93_01720 [Actinobacteria bacterium]|nr:hypothetical protein [Actinomycetota bacterium]
MRSTARQPLADRLSRTRRFVRRHRRSIAAALAAAGVVLALTSLRGAASDAPDPVVAAASSARVGAGQVAVPIVLSSPAIAGILGVGDVVDVVGISGQESATVTVVAARQGDRRSQQRLGVHLLVRSGRRRRGPRGRRAATPRGLGVGCPVDPHPLISEAR